MNVTVTEFKKLLDKKDKRTLGMVTLIYEEMRLTLRVKRHKKVFVEMPRYKIGETYIYVLRWPTQEVSDKFQEEVMRQLMEMFPEALEDKKEN